MDKWLRNNNVVKVIALLIGIMLWVVVHMDINSSSPTPTTDLQTDTINNVKVTPMENFDSNAYSVVAIEPAEVTVILKGKSSTLKRMKPGDYKYEVDLSKLGAGTHIVPVQAMNVPTTVSVDIIPQTVRVVLEEKQKKEVPVVINVTGEPAAGYKAGIPIVKPSRVFVTAPLSQLDDIEMARGEISIDKASSAVSKQVKLTVYDKNGKEVEGALNPQIVDVEVPVTSPFKTMPLQVKVTGQPAPGYAVAAMVQKPEQVTVYGPQSVLDKLDFYNGKSLQIDISGLKEDKTYSLDIPLQDQITLIDPVKVEVSFTVVPSKVKTLDNVPIMIAGPNDSTVTSIVTPETGKLQLTVEGAPTLLDKLKQSDVQAFVDVSNLPPGKHDLPIAVNLPAFLKRADASSLRATVEITQKTPSASAPAASASPAGVPMSSPSVLPTPSATPEPTPTPTPTPVTSASP